MQVYLPIAELSVNALVILMMGGAVGFLSGMLGVGGGFLMTPLLMFIGVPPAVAVGTQANQLVGASVTSVIVYWRKKAVDVPMAMTMVAGSGVGTGIGVYLFSRLQQSGHADLLVTASYIALLGTLGTLMLIEAIAAWRRAGSGRTSKRARLHHAAWLRVLPFKVRFHKSHLYVSVIIPIGIGFFIGIMVAVMGVGGGFLLVPAMIYLLGMPASVVAGTSLLQIIMTTGIAAWLQAAVNQTVDVMLAMLLLVGGTVGAHFGTRAAGRLRGEQARALLASLILAVAAKLVLDLVIPPSELFSIKILEHLQ
jgi:uncharacterized protein